MRKMILALAACALATAPLAVAAQRQGGGGRAQGGMRTPMRMLDRPLTLAATPGPTLKAVFKLTAAQEKQIGAIQTKAGEDMRALFSGGRGQRPDRAAIEAAMPKFEARMKKADAAISAVLTPGQRKQAPALLKEMHVLRGAGLPMSLAGSLKLAPAQITKLDAVAKGRLAAQRKLFENPGADRSQAREKMTQLRDASRKKALAALNAAQKAAVVKWEKEHPRRQGGPGMGGPGGPGMGRPGGPGGPGGPGMPGGRPGGGRGGARP